MSIIFLEGFDHYLNNNDGVVGWQSRWTCASADKTIQVGRFNTGQCFQIVHNGGEEDVFGSLPKYTKTLTLGFAACWNWYNSENTLIRLCDTNNIVHTDLVVAQDGTFKVYADGASTPFATSVPGYGKANVWFYIEMAITIASDGTGTCQVWLEGDKIIDVSNVSTTNKSGSGVNTLALVEQFAYVNFDDIYVTDNLTPLGGLRITNFSPASDAAGSGWTSSTDGSSLFSKLNQGINSANYISASTVGAQQLFGVSGLPTFSNVCAVQIVSFNTKDNSGFRKAAAVISDGTNTKVGQNITISSSPLFAYQVFDTNALNNAWSNADMQTFQFGIKVTQ